LGLSIVTNGIVCVRGGEAALPKLLVIYAPYGGTWRGNLCDSTAFLFQSASAEAESSSAVVQSALAVVKALDGKKLKIYMSKFNANKIATSRAAVS